MKTQYWMLLLLSLILSAVLTGCSVGASAEQEMTKPLDNAAWPTPVPTTAPPSPTPFPKVAADQVRVLDDAVSSQQSAVSDPPSAIGGQQSAVNDQPSAVNDQPSAASDQPSAITAQVRGPKGVNLRQGPSTSYPIVAVLRSGETVRVLGVVEGARDWVFVERDGGKQGWASLPLLEVAGSLADVPSLPAPAAASGQQSAISSQPSAISYRWPDRVPAGERQRHHGHQP
jgi:uncharacterized protein YraI